MVGKYGYNTPEKPHTIYRMVDCNYQEEWKWMNEWMKNMENFIENLFVDLTRAMQSDSIQEMYSNKSQRSIPD